MMFQQSSLSLSGGVIEMEHDVRGVVIYIGYADPEEATR